MKYYLILLFISNSVYYAIAQSMHSYKWNTQTVSMWHKLCHNSINNTFFIGLYNDGREALDENGILKIRNDFYSSLSSRTSNIFNSDFKRITGKYPSMTETDFFSHAINRDIH